MNINNNKALSSLAETMWAKHQCIWVTAPTVANGLHLR